MEKEYEFFDVKGLADYLNISEKTVYQLVHQRTFPSFKVLGKYRIIKSELYKWIEKQTKVKKG